MSRKELRATFEEVPELYDRARPTYPEQLFDDLVELSCLPEGGRILEVGPGTGQATLPLARRGFDLVAVELGPRLADRARRNLAAFPNVTVLNADVERWEPSGPRFDAVVAFTALHWLDPESRVQRAASFLRERGALAVVDTRHVLPAGGDRFWIEVQEDYDAVAPSPDNAPPPPPEEVHDLGELEESGLFGDVAVRRYLWDVEYGPEEYVAVLDTYSGHRAMAPEKRRELYRRIRARIEATPHGRVTKTYLAILNVGRLP